jgi:hypothetical protein
MRSPVRQSAREIRHWLEATGMDNYIGIFELLVGDPDLRETQRHWISEIQK